MTAQQSVRVAPEDNIPTEVEARLELQKTVSYTHLTLPTIYSV